jgi:hypothetical protein
LGTSSPACVADCAAACTCIVLSVLWALAHTPMLKQARSQASPKLASDKRLNSPCASFYLFRFQPVAVLRLCATARDVWDVSRLAPRVRKFDYTPVINSERSRYYTTVAASHIGLASHESGNGSTKTSPGQTQIDNIRPAPRPDPMLWGRDCCQDTTRFSDSIEG